MDAIKEWAIALCMSAITCTIWQMMAPKSTNSRWLHIIIAGIFLSCMLIPIYDWKNLTLPALPDTSSIITENELSDKIEEQVARQTNSTIEALCRHYLKNYDMTIQKVSVVTDSSAEEGIYISCVKIYLDKPNAADTFTAKQLLENQLGIPVKVVVDEQDKNTKEADQ